jgi:NADPH2:quinone reductase
MPNIDPAPAVPAPMRAARFHHYGAPDVLRTETVPAPEPGPGEALIRVEQ